MLNTIILFNPHLRRKKKIFCFLTKECVVFAKHSAIFNARLPCSPLISFLFFFHRTPCRLFAPLPLYHTSLRTALALIYQERGIQNLLIEEAIGWVTGPQMLAVHLAMSGF